jgi:PDZ domain (Also known as DHR or GLGF).
MFPTGCLIYRRLLGGSGCAAFGFYLVFMQGCGASHRAQPTDQKSCTTYEDECPGDKRFYRSRFVRECLQLEQQNLVNDSQTCWAELEMNIRSDPNFVSRERLTDSDLARIRQKAAQSDRASSQLGHELQTCIRLSPSKRDAQITCYQDFLKRHAEKLSRSERFEVEQSIASLKQSHDRAQGVQEDTIEHAGKLLGLQLHAEDEGIRIDAVVDGPLAGVGLSEQDLILTIDGVRMSELPANEAIANLEACRQHPIKLLVRHGGLKEVRFTLVEVFCAKNHGGQRLSQITLAPMTCSEANSQELNLGLSLCYLANEGMVEVTEVCQGSPAAEAGVLPGHRYRAIETHRLLGKSYADLQSILQANPAPLFSESGGVLRSPLRLKATWSDPKQMEGCKAALRSRSGGARGENK